MKKATECTSLQELRVQIDQIDREIVALIGQRYEYVKAAVAFKTTEADVRAPERLNSMLKERRHWASDAGLDPDMIDKLYRDLVAYFVNAELKLVDRQP